LFMKTVVCGRIVDEEPEEGVSSSWRPHWAEEHGRYYYKNMANKQDIKWEPVVSR
jgi:hypothetical protein